MMNKVQLMAHMIPYYPDQQKSVEVVDALVQAGISQLEVQFPFSDPTADGPVIEAACTKALSSGFTVDKGFAFVAAVAEACKQAGIEIFIMTYASLVHRRGVKEFIEASLKAGASGLIVPDLPPDSDEGLYALGKQAGLSIVPVITISISQKRLEMVRKLDSKYLYCALRAGTTGSATNLDKQVLDFLDLLKGQNKKIFGGFGIDGPARAAALAPHVHSVVVGSAIVRVIDAANAQKQSVKDAVLHFVHQLQGI